MNLFEMSEAIVDSALSGKKAELSFSCTVDNWPNNGPVPALTKSQATIATTASHSGRLPFTLDFDTNFLSQGYSRFIQWLNLGAWLDLACANCTKFPRLCPT